MKTLLVAINAKYIHSNLAVYSLQEYAGQKGETVSIREFTINQMQEHVLKEIYLEKPDLLIFSCYIWNIEFVLDVSREFHKLCPQVPIWVGGPEVSYEAVAFLRREQHIKGIMLGEGEATFARLCAGYRLSKRSEEVSEASARDDAEWQDELHAFLKQMQGIAYRDQYRNDVVHEQPLTSLLSMDELPFVYQNPALFEHKIIYYETSRGCPFRCSYCLSSIDKKLRFRSLEKVLPELQIFLDHKVPQVKFVDRTFNCDHKHAMTIWKYIHEHDNGVTNFHFEVSADLLTEEEIALIREMRPGLIQLEIGVQSTNGETIREIQRSMDLAKVLHSVSSIKEKGNIHQHLDLIAGLPKEDYATFRHSFDEIYDWKPDQLQLGFLKVLKGSYMYEHADEYGITYRDKAPYEVLSTKWITYAELLEVKQVEEMLEIHYNSGQFRQALECLEMIYESAFQMFLDLGRYYQEQGYGDRNHTRVQRADIFLAFAVSKDPDRTALYREALLYDLYKLEKSKRRPDWAERELEKKQISGYLRSLGMEKKYCHVERFCALTVTKDRVSVARDPEEHMILFDYENRNPLTNEANRIVIE